MPRIFDNIESHLLAELQQGLRLSKRADFCTGYFNLRGWRNLADYVDSWPGGDNGSCRLLVGMLVTPSEALKRALRHPPEHGGPDNRTAAREKRSVAAEFRNQLTIGSPTNADELALRRLAKQLRDEKVLVKIYLRHGLHAKLYLLYRNDPINPVIAYVGSSNLTFAGLANQGELNIDALDSDACKKLQQWFEDRWEDRWSVDISKDLAAIIEESWAGDRLISPYQVYLKMAWHLAQDARIGLDEFRVPAEFENELFDFQTAAVKIAAHNLHKRGGVLIGDVVGLGKTIMATALAKIFEDDFQTETLIICPKNLVSMWEDYVHTYRLHAKVLSLSRVLKELPDRIRRYRLVLIDESHNLRNKSGKRWSAIREYIAKNDSLCILLSATPYNKTYLDLSAQLGLFLNPDQDLGIRPECLIASLGGEPEFIAHHQCSPRSLVAFEQSEKPDDWRDLMRLFMVRRTRAFVIRNYAREDKRGKFLEFKDGTRSYFPTRVPKTLAFKVEDSDPQDPYARFYSKRVVQSINSLSLPRYGLGNYLKKNIAKLRNENESRTLAGLSRAGTRLMGFCRTNLFKRLESSGPAFLLSMKRHVLRNFVFIYALEHQQDIPIGSQDAAWLDTRNFDGDSDLSPETTDATETGGDEVDDIESLASEQWTEEDYRRHAKQVYDAYRTQFRKRFTWLNSSVFDQSLGTALLEDALELIRVLDFCGSWNPSKDTKLDQLVHLITVKHPTSKVLIFSQFADTAHYLAQQAVIRKVENVAVATGGCENPTDLAWRFSPESNHKGGTITDDDEIRILIATDVLSEGQNLQDCAIIVNYDIPWAIIRLIQRAGRVDRIGQKAARILCYTFMPADGVNRLIQLRDRVQQRLDDNAELVGSDEEFFEGRQTKRVIRDLYNERSGILDEQDDAEVDLSSYAYQVWKNATEDDAALARVVEALPNVVFATKAVGRDLDSHRGVLTYMRTSSGNDALAWIDSSGRSVTQSQLRILKAAECAPDTPALPRTEEHHELTKRGLDHIVSEEASVGGALGRPSSVRSRTYKRLKQYRTVLGTIERFNTESFVKALDEALEEVYRFPLLRSASEALTRHIKARVDDRGLADLVVRLKRQGRLCAVSDATEDTDPEIICSLGLV